MKYVFVKDSEGYVFKKPESELSPNEKIISEKEYIKKSGLKYYEKEFENNEAKKIQVGNKNLHHH